MSDPCVVCLYRSAGMASDGGATGNNNVPRQMACPQGENNISDIAISSMGTILYSAASNIVRIWDLRMYVLLSHSLYIFMCV